LKLIIQIPAFNESKTIGATLADLPKKIDGVDQIETLVIDDGSSDGTGEVARKAGATHVVRLLSNRGLSTAFKTGIATALRLGADIIVNTDADNQYHGADVAKIVAPIIDGTADVVVGDREVGRSPHMRPLKRALQMLGSRAVSIASGVDVRDVTSGFRAFSREAALQINVFNPFTYTLETIIQAGHHNLVVKCVPVETNPPTRPSRLYRGIGSYVRKSSVTVFRVSTLYRPLQTFFAIGALLFLSGTAIGARFLYFFSRGQTGHVQSLILAAVLLLAGFQTMLIGLVADLISVNRRLSEEILIRSRQRDRGQPVRRRPQPREEKQPYRKHKTERPPAQSEPLGSQWVWLADEAKLEGHGEESPAVPGQSRRRRRRRRRPSPNTEPGSSEADS
jgi:glycosyltransferase involved in cell wall biosynthesis